MRRRMCIILEKLRWLSDQPRPAARIPLALHDTVDVTEAIIRYHIELCEEAGFIKEVQHSPAHSEIEPWHRLTWAGHEFMAENK